MPQGSYLLYADPAMQGQYPPVENWLGSLRIGFHKDRAVFNVSYRKFEKTIRAYVDVPRSANFTTYALLLEPIHVKGWCFELSSSIFERDRKKLKLYTMLFQDDYSIKYPAYPMPYDVVSIDAGKAPWRGGLRASLTFDRLFMQGSVLASFRSIGVDKNNSTALDVNSFHNNFLLAGYSVPLKAGSIKTLEINLQGRNLFYSRSYFMNSYLGAGVNLSF
jgi:hypothetical protein